MIYLFFNKSSNTILKLPQSIAFTSTESRKIEKELSKYQFDNTQLTTMYYFVINGESIITRSVNLNNLDEYEISLDTDEFLLLSLPNYTSILDTYELYEANVKLESTNFMHKIAITEQTTGNYDGNRINYYLPPSQELERNYQVKYVDLVDCVISLTKTAD